MNLKKYATTRIFGAINCIQFPESRENPELFKEYLRISKMLKFHLNKTKYCPLTYIVPHNYLSLLASRSDSRRVRMSPSRTGPFTFRMIDLLGSPKNSTLTYIRFHIGKTYFSK